MTIEARPSFQKFFQTTDERRAKFLARVLGLFSEEPVRIWCRDPRSPYEDLGRPTVTSVEESGRGLSLDFTLRSRRDGHIFVAEMKCEIANDNFRSMILRSRSQLNRHAKDKEAFRRFLAIANDPTSHRVMVNNHSTMVDGAILIWGACTSEGRQEVLDGTGISDVLSLEEIIASLLKTRNPEFLELIEQRSAWCKELFGYFSCL